MPTDYTTMKQTTIRPYNRAVQRLRRHYVPRTVVVQSTQQRYLGERGFKTFLKEITELRDRGTLSKEQFERLVLLACGIYVEQEVEKRVGKVLESTFSSERLARYLPPSH